MKTVLGLLSKCFHEEVYGGSYGKDGIRIHVSQEKRILALINSSVYGMTTKVDWNNLKFTPK